MVATAQKKWRRTGRDQWSKGNLWIVKTIPGNYQISLDGPGGKIVGEQETLAKAKGHAEQLQAMVDRHQKDMGKTIIEGSAGVSFDPTDAPPHSQDWYACITLGDTEVPPVIGVAGAATDDPTPRLKKDDWYVCVTMDIPEPRVSLTGKSSSSPAVSLTLNPTAEASLTEKSQASLKSGKGVKSERPRSRGHSGKGRLAPKSRKTAGNKASQFPSGRS